MTANGCSLCWATLVVTTSEALASGDPVRTLSTGCLNGTETTDSTSVLRPIEDTVADALESGRR
jgi:hypothetical protein